MEGSPRRLRPPHLLKFERLYNVNLRNPHKTIGNGTCRMPDEHGVSDGLHKHERKDNPNSHDAHFVGAALHRPTCGFIRAVILTAVESFHKINNS
jgi:hypothetical protein